MSRFLTESAGRRRKNASALAAFGVTTDGQDTLRYRTVREGSGPTIYTVGYERRSGDGLMGDLVDAAVQVLVDVRERPISRKADFRKSSLEALCREAGIRYESWTRLGSTAHQRDELRESGDFSTFRRRFRDLVKRGRTQEIEELAEQAKSETIALICYEREHAECHRSIVADLLADEVDACVIAIL